MAANANYGSMLLSSHPNFVTYYGPNHVNEVPVIIVDQSGTLIIRLYQKAIFQTTGSNSAYFLRADGTKIDGVIAAQFQVSAAVVVNSCLAFEDIYHANQWSASDPSYVDMDYSESLPVELVLRALHDSPSDEQSSFVTLAQVEQIMDIIQAFKCSKDRFRHWFFEWLASTNLPPLETLDPTASATLATLCSQFKHPFSTLLTSTDTLPLIPKCITNYAPILVRSLRQLYETIYLQRTLSRSAYASAGFSPRFVLKYGTPVECWSDFYALMMVNTTTTTITTSTRDITHLLPKQKKHKDCDTDWETLRTKVSYLNWANCVDDKARHKNPAETTVWRRDMEAAWVRNAVRCFEEEVERLGDVFWEKPTVREALQWALRKVIEKRFHPMTRIEAYWEKKGEGMPRDLWAKKTVRMEEVTEMKSASKNGEDDAGMGGLLDMMEHLQVQAANASEPADLSAEEAMIEAMNRISCDEAL